MKKSLVLFPVVLLLFLLNARLALSQQVTFQEVASPIGNFSNLVGSIAQDKNGYMWIATSGGLYKYDGYRFKLFSHDPANPNSPGENKMELVYADSKGIIWIATWTNGLDRLDPVSGTFTHFRHSPDVPGSLSNNTVRALLEDREGTLWVGTNRGLDKFDPKTEKFQNYHNDPANPSSLSCDRVRKLYEDRAGNIWVGTGSVWSNDGGEPGEGGLNRFDKKTGSFFRYLHDPTNTHSLINNKVQAICEDSRGTFWVGTAGDGLHIMDKAAGTFKRLEYDGADPEKLSRPPLKNGFGTDHITFIAEDALGKIWVGTLGNGIVRHDPKRGTTTHYTNKDQSAGFTHTSAWSFCNSRDGMFWIGTFQGGLFRVDPYQKDIQHISTGSRVTSISEDPVSGTWVGTPEGLLLRNKVTGNIKKFTSSPATSGSISNNQITSLFHDNEGVLWIGTANGLNRLNKPQLTFTHYVNNSKNERSISPGNIFAIEDAGEGFLWIGTGSGVDLMEKKTGTFQHFRNNLKGQDGFAPNNISVLLRDKSDNLFIGSFFGGGLTYLHRATKSFKLLKKGLSVFSLHIDASGIVWVGTQGAGLYRSTNANATDFVKIAASGSNIGNTTVSSIKEDSRHNIWINTNTGIYKVNPQTNEATVFSANYGISTGYLSLYGGHYGSGGEMYFGNFDGYHVFSPDNLLTNPTPPQVMLTDFRIGGRSVLPGKGGPLTAPLEQAEKITLQHDQNVIACDFAGIHFSSPENNRHMYKLENHDPEWREAGAEKTAYYYNVPPGNYQFKVKAASSEGHWAERNINIIILPPWWRTWWAYCLYGLLFIGIGYFLHRFQRGRVIRAEQERSRVRELAQAKEIEKAYTELKATQAQLIQSEKMASLGELTAGIAHEIQNPLNFVNNFSEVNKELIFEMREEIKKGNIEEVAAIANDIEENEAKINQHGKRADAIVKGMLQHSRTSTGMKEPTDINALADEYLRLSYHGFRAKDKTFNAKLETHFDESVDKLELVPQDIGRVLLNILNNAFFSIGEKKKQLSESFEPALSVATKRHAGQVEIVVKDNGLGISKNILDKIYQPFFTTKATGQGTGLGLSLSYDIIKAHQGELKVDTEEGEYAEFTIILPAQKQNSNDLIG